MAKSSHVRDSIALEVSKARISASALSVPWCKVAADDDSRMGGSWTAEVGP